MNKWLSLWCWFLLFQLILISSCLYAMIKIDREQQEKEIEIYKKDIYVKKEESTPFFGYISIPSYGMNRLIKYGNPEIVVKQTYIGIFGTVPENYPKDSLILVGHSRENQFAVLHKSKIGTEVSIARGNYQYIYKIENKKMIDASDLSFLEQIKEQQLILITCFDEADKRLVVTCNLVKSIPI